MFTLESFIRNERTGDGEVRNTEIIANQISDRAHFDPGLSRPYRARAVINGREVGPERVWVDVTQGHRVKTDKDGRQVTNTRGQVIHEPILEPQLVAERRAKDLPVINVVDNATVLRKDQWIMIDQAVAMASRKRLRAWSDLRAANTFGGFDGMATPILEFERLNDAGEAVVDMDALSEGNDFAATYTLQGQPLPITHCDFTLSQRFLAASRRNGGPAADTTRAEMAGRRVAETIEQTLIGTQTGLKWGTSTDYGQASQVYGYTTHPERLTVTGATAPTGSNGTTILTAWLDHRDELYQRNFYGPFVIYTATSYDQFLDDEFKTESDKSLRDRLKEIEGVQDIRRLDYLTTAGSLLWVEMGENVQAVNGMELTTVQWVEKGGLELRFKVMAIQCPRIKSVNINSSTTGPASVTGPSAPILHVTTA